MDEPIRHPLAYARWLHGWSQAELARRMKEAARRRDRRAGTSRQRVSLWEKSVMPDEFSQLLLSDIFDVPYDQVTALGWPHWLPGHETPAPLGAGLTVTVLRKAAQMAVDRRTFLTHTPAALGALALEWATIDPALAAGTTSGRPVDPALVDWLESSARNLNSLPTALRQHTGPLLDGHLTTVVELLEQGSYGHAVGIRLHSLAASLSQTLAWHRFDHEHHAAANRYWHAAVHAAHQARDRDMGAGALSDIAYQSIWLGQPRAAADSLEHALSRTTNPTARSLLLLRKARAHAMLNEPRACYRDLAQAEKLLDSTADIAPQWCSWMSPAVMQPVKLFQPGMSQEGGGRTGGACLKHPGLEIELGHRAGRGRRRLPAAPSRQLTKSQRTRTRARAITSGLMAQVQPPIVDSLLTMTRGSHGDARLPPWRTKS
ncbi:helix-turn-helix transcriptional regulator [Streptomyces sp. NPDC088775]|uniref:helix-turn-helix transcriptional regulator n=1 Tax=Streptomyces sp. NPDC088775 TaxID=3365896 RepID=UPI003821EB66